MPLAYTESVFREQFGEAADVDLSMKTCMNPPAKMYEYKDGSGWFSYMDLICEGCRLPDGQVLHVCSACSCRVSDLLVAVRFALSSQYLCELWCGLGRKLDLPPVGGRQAAPCLGMT